MRPTSSATAGPLRAFRWLMAVDPRDESTRSSGRNGRVNQGWPEPVDASGTPIVDVRFDSGGLAMLRVQLRACALQAGFPDDRVADVVLAVHELAANAVRHGGGAGRLRVWNGAGSLQCQVDDGGDHRKTVTAAPVTTSVNSLPCEPGHGLWVVRQVADRIQSLSGSLGASVMITFDYTR
jgi:serine/threonine-protein kinase RsbW